MSGGLPPIRPVFGIHVGNSTACLALYKHDETRATVEVIANNAGDRVMPAIVTITENENVVGAACKSLMISSWKTTVTCNKRLLDKETPEDPTKGEWKVTTFINEHDELCYSLPLENREVVMTPTEIASCIFESLYEMAKSAVPGLVGEISCVVIVPKQWSMEARFKTRTAAECVGWDVLHIISEPAAAVLGYNMLEVKPQQPPAQTVLVYRIGGYSCDATIIDLKFGMITIVDTEYSEEVGGKSLISTMTTYLADEFYRRTKLDPKESRRAMTKLKLAVENCIHVLSTIESANFLVESVCEGVDFSYTMSRARFESLLFPFLEKFTRPIFTLLSKLEMTPDKVTTVVLCGGLMKIPRIRKYISDVFQETSANILPLPNGINYDEVLACGAAHQGGSILTEALLDNYLPNVIDISTLEFPVTIKVEGSTIDCDDAEFEQGQPLPIHRMIVLGTCEPVVKLIFTQVESPDVTLRGEAEFRNLGHYSEVRVDIDIDGIKLNTCENGGFKQQVVRMMAHPNPV